MFKRSCWVVVLLAIAVSVCLVWGTDASALDKGILVPVAEVACPPVPCCCVDARICVQEQASRACYTEAGLQAFVALFKDAAAIGVENATIRAMNATKVVPDCTPCDPPKKK